MKGIFLSPSELCDFILASDLPEELTSEERVARAVNGVMSFLHAAAIQNVLGQANIEEVVGELLTALAVYGGVFTKSEFASFVEQVRLPQGEYIGQ